MSDTVTISAREHGALCLGADLLLQLRGQIADGLTELEAHDCEQIVDVANAICDARKPATLEERALSLLREFTTTDERKNGYPFAWPFGLVKRALDLIEEAGRRADK